MAISRVKAERLADEELMPLIAKRDAEAFEVFYDRHGGVAYSLAYRIVGSRQAAEDVTQEAFISIWRSGARFDPTRGSVRSWTLGIVRNRAIDALRRDAGKAPKLDFDDEALLEQRSSEQLTEDEVVRRDQAAGVRGALQGAAERPVEGDPARLLRRLQPLGDRRDAGDAAGYGEGQDEAGDGEDPHADGGGAAMSEESHERRREDVAAYAIGALEPDEAAEFERHLAGCEQCRRDLRWLAPAVSSLGESVERREPPASLRSALMETVREEAARPQPGGPARADAAASAASCCARRSASRRWR